MSHLKTMALILTIAGWSNSAIAQTVSVHERGNAGILILVDDERGTTPEHAGQLAMQRACEEVLERGQRRGFTHMGVNEYRTSEVSMQVQSQPSGNDYHVTGQGQVYNTPRASQSTTIMKGHAFLQVIMMAESTAQGMSDTMQMIDARSCSVIN